MIRQDNPETHALAAQIISAGGIVAFRTDTFYGLGVDPFNQSALRSLKSLKGREEGKPILVIIARERETARFFAARNSLFRKVSARHWPGALTLVAQARPELDEELTAGTGTIGLRLPDDEAVRAFVGACGGALTATSANPAGEPPARTAVEVARYFPRGVGLVVDAGEARTDRPSTVLDVSGRDARLLREGVVGREELRETLGAFNAGLLG